MERPAVPQADDRTVVNALDSIEESGHVRVGVRRSGQQAILTVTDDGWGISVKLRESHAEARLLPFTEPTGYGLGKAGWVSARFRSGEPVLFEMLKAWVRESYLQIAPLKLAKQLIADTPEPPPKAATRSTPAARKAAPKKRVAATRKKKVR